MKMKLRLKQMIAGSALAWLALAPPGFAAFQIIGDDICVVASEYKKFEAEIERARKGDLSRSNSTLVNPRKNRPPIKEKYSTQVSLTKDSGGNAHVAAVALVSDDGCDVRVSGEQWLKESGKGHDISRGLRRYGKLLLPGDENRFDIEYSQTFYDPAVLENDLDDLTMVVLPIEIDISVKDSRGNVNDRILVKKGETIDVALHPMFWELFPSQMKGAPKCNIFVYVVAYDVGVKIDMILRLPFMYRTPPLVEEWCNPAEKIKTSPYPRQWTHYYDQRFPEPGFIVCGTEHMGILDYDGRWISAGDVNVVNKRACFPRIGKDFYLPKVFRERESN